MSDVTLNELLALMAGFKTYDLDANSAKDLDNIDIHYSSGGSIALQSPYNDSWDNVEDFITHLKANQGQHKRETRILKEGYNLTLEAFEELLEYLDDFYRDGISDSTDGENLYINSFGSYWVVGGHGNELFSGKIEELLDLLKKRKDTFICRNCNEEFEAWITQHRDSFTKETLMKCIKDPFGDMSALLQSDPCSDITINVECSCGNLTLSNKDRDALSQIGEVEEPKPVSYTYLVCVDGEYCRDAQIYNGKVDEDIDHVDSNEWGDFHGNHIVYRSIKANSKVDAIETAAENLHVDKKILIAYLLQEE